MAGHEEILDFWFDGVDRAGVPAPDCLLRWFRGGEAFDTLIREGFGGQVESALAGSLDAWAETALGRLALVLLLDQFPRNIFRGDRRAFSGDARALSLAREATVSGLDAGLRPIERYFLFLPFEHAEDSADQARAVSLYQELISKAPKGGEAHFIGAADWARRHQVVIERFGRFPSRNAALGRSSTDAEIVFLAENPLGF
jgi:uncharacterized protein (DUF924 family)